MLSRLWLAGNSGSWLDSTNGLGDGGGGGDGGRSHGGSGGVEAWGANLDGDALLISTEATVLVGSNADSLLLGNALGVLSGSLSLGEVNSLEDGDGTLDGEGSVLGLDCEGGVSSLSALAAVSLADLVVLSVGDGSQLGDLSGFGVLLVALGETGTETWEGVEGAWALNVEGGEAEVGGVDVGGAVAGSLTSTEVDDLRLSEVVGGLLSEAGLEGVLGSGSDDTSEEGEEDDLHFMFV